MKENPEEYYHLFTIISCISLNEKRNAGEMEIQTCPFSPLPLYSIRPSSKQARGGTLDAKAASGSPRPRWLGWLTLL